MASYSARLLNLDTGAEYQIVGIVLDDVIRLDVKFDESNRVIDAGRQSDFRYLVLETKERVEFPMSKFMVTWSKERQEIMEESQAKKASLHVAQ